MVASLLIPIVRKYAGKSMLYVLIGLLALGIYWKWKSSIYDEGYQAAVAKYEKRDAETERRGRELLKLKQHEADLINKQNAERAYNAAQIYNDHYSRILADRARMPIYPAPTSRSCDPLPGSGKNTGGIGGTGATVHEPRISEGIVQSIEDGQLACEQLLNLMTGNDR